MESSLTGINDQISNPEVHECTDLLAANAVTFQNRKSLVVYVGTLSVSGDPFEDIRIRQVVRLARFHSCTCHKVNVSPYSVWNLTTPRLDHR